MSRQPITVITSNGSHCAGEQPATIDELLQVIEHEPLDRKFEKYGNFIYRNPQTCVYLGQGKYRDTGHIYPGQNITRFSGNFLHVSHVFNIDTSDPVVVERLTKAIRSNKQRADYQAQQAAA